MTCNSPTATPARSAAMQTRRMATGFPARDQNCRKSAVAIYGPVQITATMQRVAKPLQPASSKIGRAACFDANTLAILSMGAMQ